MKIAFVFSIAKVVPYNIIIYIIIITFHRVIQPFLGISETLYTWILLDDYDPLR